MTKKTEIFDRRRPRYETPEELEELIEGYFQSLQLSTIDIDTTPEGESLGESVRIVTRPPTMAGLALAIGCTLRTLQNYDGKPEFRPIIARAKLRIAEFAETALYHRDMSRGAAFVLQHGFGYGSSRDREGVEEPKQEYIAPDERAGAIPFFEEGDG